MSSVAHLPDGVVTVLEYEAVELKTDEEKMLWIAVASRRTVIDADAAVVAFRYRTSSKPR